MYDLLVDSRHEILSSGPQITLLKLAEMIAKYTEKVVSGTRNFVLRIRY